MGRGHAVDGGSHHAGERPGLAAQRIAGARPRSRRGCEQPELQLRQAVLFLLDRGDLVEGGRACEGRIVAGRHRVPGQSGHSPPLDAGSGGAGLHPPVAIVGRSDCSGRSPLLPGGGFLDFAPFFKCSFLGSADLSRGGFAAAGGCQGGAAFRRAGSAGGFACLRCHGRPGRMPFFSCRSLPSWPCRIRDSGNWLPIPCSMGWRPAACLRSGSGGS